MKTVSCITIAVILALSTGTAFAIAMFKCPDGSTVITDYLSSEQIKAGCKLEKEADNRPTVTGTPKNETQTITIDAGGVKVPITMTKNPTGSSGSSGRDSSTEFYCTSSCKFARDGAIESAGYEQHPQIRDYKFQKAQDNYIECMNGCR